MGLLATNVYMADVASTKNIVFFNYMRQVFITLGAILMYATVQIIYKVMGAGGWQGYRTRSLTFADTERTILGFFVVLHTDPNFGYRLKKAKSWHKKGHLPKGLALSI